MNKLIEEIRKKVYAWLIKTYRKQLTQQDIEDITQETMNRLLKKYHDKCFVGNEIEMQRLAYAIAKNETLKKIEKIKKITLESIDDVAGYWLAQEVSAAANISWGKVINHPDLVEKPKYQFILERIIYYEGDCIGKDLYQAIIKEYEEKFNDCPTYDNFRKIKSRMGPVLRRILYQYIK